MEKAMITLLENSVTMSIIIISLLLLTPLRSKKYAAAWWYYTWLIVVIGLVIPLRPKFGAAFIQIQRADPQQPSPVNQLITEYTGTVEMTDTFVFLPNSVNQSMSISWPQWAGLVWIAGMAAFFLFHLFRHYQFMKLVKRWGRDTSDPCLLSILQQVQIDRRISKQVKLKICPLVTSPMMIGFINPVILLPQHSFSSDELKFILTHELIHFSRKDVWYNAAILTARAIHWFNPVVHLMARAISVHCEASCDEAVIKNASLEDRRRYGEMIIGVVRNQSKMKTAFSTTFYGGKKGMKNRLFSIMDESRKRKNVAVLCLVLTGTLVSGVVFAYGYDGNSNPSRNTNHVAGNLNDVVFSNDKELERISNHQAAEGGISPAAHSSVDAYERGDGSGQTDESLKSYLNYGVTYEPKTDRYLFENKMIRLLIDENMKVSGETNALYFDASGEIDVKVIRGADNRIEKITEVNEKALQDLSDQYRFRISEGNIIFQ